MIRLEQIISEFKSYNPAADVSPLQKAYILTARLLSSPSTSGESNINAHLEVALVLAKLRLDVESVVAGMLFSTIRDNQIQLGELSGQIGEATAKIVYALDQLPSSASERETKDEVAQAMQQLIAAATKDPRVIFVKLAVRLVRLRHWDSFSKLKSQSFASETLEVFAPLAERLGLNHLKIELEDLSFSLLYHKEFGRIKDWLLSQSDFHQKFLTDTRQTLLDIFEEHGVQAEIQQRIKHSYSIYLKALKYNIHYQDIHDLLGFRVIVPLKEDTYRVLGLVHDHFSLVQGRFKDYITYSKANEYQSLHTTVLNDEGVGFEVQIRTAEMHEVAEFGIAAHWYYKAKLPHRSSAASDRLFWLKDLSASLGIAANPKESLEIFTRELYSDLVYAYSPKGKIIKLPFGSTVLDFAYAIHSELGNRCAGAKIDGQLKPLQHLLKHGDQVYVITEETSQVKQTWLSYARTVRSLSQIRQQLRKKDHAEARKLGQEIFEEQVNQFEDPEAFLRSDQFQSFLSKQGYDQKEVYWSELGFGHSSMNELKLFLANNSVLGSKRKSKVISLRLPKKPDVVKIPGAEGIKIRLAKCCNPLRGDDILGIMNQGDGVTVHQVDCRNLNGIDPQRKIDAQWALNPESRKTVQLLLHFDQEIKTHLQIMKIFASAKVLLLECRHRLLENKSTQEVTCQVATLDQLAKVLNRLNSLNSVTARRVFESDSTTIPQHQS